MVVNFLEVVSEVLSISVVSRCSSLFEKEMKLISILHTGCDSMYFRVDSCNE